MNDIDKLRFFDLVGERLLPEFEGGAHRRLAGGQPTWEPAPWSSSRQDLLPDDTFGVLLVAERPDDVTAQRIRHSGSPLEWDTLTLFAGERPLAARTDNAERLALERRPDNLPPPRKPAVVPPGSRAADEADEGAEYKFQWTCDHHPRAYMSGGRKLELVATYTGEMVNAMKSGELGAIAKLGASWIARDTVHLRLDCDDPPDKIIFRPTPGSGGLVAVTALRSHKDGFHYYAIELAHQHELRFMPLLPAHWRPNRYRASVPGVGSISVALYHPDKWSLALQIPARREFKTGRALDYNVRTGAVTKTKSREATTNHGGKESTKSEEVSETLHTAKSGKQALDGTAILKGPNRSVQSNIAIEGDKVRLRQSKVGENSTTDLVQTRTPTDRSVRRLEREVVGTAIKTTERREVHTAGASVSVEKSEGVAKSGRPFSVSWNGLTPPLKLVKYTSAIIEIKNAILGIIDTVKSFAPKVGWYCDFSLEVLSGNLALAWHWQEAKSGEVFLAWSAEGTITFLSITLEVGFGIKAGSDWGAQIYVSLTWSLARTISAKREALEDTHVTQRVVAALEGEVGIRITAGKAVSVTANASTGLELACQFALFQNDAPITAELSMTWTGLSGRIAITIEGFDFSYVAEKQFVDSKELGKIAVPSGSTAPPQPKGWLTRAGIARVIERVFGETEFPIRVYEPDGDQVDGSEVALRIAETINRLDNERGGDLCRYPKAIEGFAVRVRSELERTAVKQDNWLWSDYASLNLAQLSDFCNDLPVYGEYTTSKTLSELLAWHADPADRNRRELKAATP